MLFKLMSNGGRVMKIWLATFKNLLGKKNPETSRTVVKKTSPTKIVITTPPPPPGILNNHFLTNKY